MIGDAVRRSPTLKFQTCLPVLASRPTMFPSSSPVNTMPPAFETAPAHMLPIPVMGYSHTRAPVFGLMARRNTCPPSSVAPPPEKFFIGTGFCAELVYMPHCSSVITYSSPVPGLYVWLIQLVAPFTLGQTQLPSGVGSLPGTLIGRPLASTPLAQVMLSISLVARRNSPVTRSSK